MHRKASFIHKHEWLLDFGSSLEFYCLMDNHLTAALQQKDRDQALIFTLSTIIFNLFWRHETFKCNERNLEPCKMNHRKFVTELLDMWLFLVAKYVFIISARHKCRYNSVEREELKFFLISVHKCIFICDLSSNYIRILQTVKCTSLVIFCFCT